jgi:hypothetical protein
MNGHFKKIEWKGIVKKSINTYWNTKLQLDCQSKSSLSLLSTTSLEMGKTHIVWDSINNSVRDVRQAITKARMLTGTYMLQTLKSKFNQSEVDSVKGGSSYRSSMPTILMKKLAGPPTLYCLQAISLIETFSHGENSYCLGLDQQFSSGCKTGHHKGKNTNRNIHATNTKESFLISLYSGQLVIT